MEVSTFFHAVPGTKSCILCPLFGSVRNMEMSINRGSTVTLAASWLRTGNAAFMVMMLELIFSCTVLVGGGDSREMIRDLENGVSD